MPDRASFDIERDDEDPEVCKFRYTESFNEKQRQDPLFQEALENTVTGARALSAMLGITVEADEASVTLQGNGIPTSRVADMITMEFLGWSNIGKMSITQLVCALTMSVGQQAADAESARRSLESAQEVVREALKNMRGDTTSELL